jgi:pyruvate/2-oxoglutarate dehydrogenase complex dihydrolipoamide acyltransferase (E2) component
MKVNTAGLFSLAQAAPEPVVGEEPSVEVSIEVTTERAPRVRKTTLDHFNEEMAVLDRPLEGEVEYYDEPRPRRWRVPTIGAAIFALSCGAYLGVLRHRGAADAATAATTARPPVAAPAVAAAPPAEAAPPAAPSEAAGAPPAEAAPAAAAPAPTPTPILADESRADGHRHHRGRHSSEHHHRHHAGHGHHARG